MITIICNFTVLVQHSYICFGYFMPMSHNDTRKARQPPSNTSPSLFPKNGYILSQIYKLSKPQPF